MKNPQLEIDAIAGLAPTSAPIAFAPPKDPRELLKRARALVEGGWCQGRAFQHSVATGKMQYCMVGALSEAAGRNNFHSELELYIADSGFVATAFRRLTIAVGYASIPGWNDQPERTRGEVLAAFDRAIAVAEEKCYG